MSINYVYEGDNNAGQYPPGPDLLPYVPKNAAPAMMPITPMQQTQHLGNYYIVPGHQGPQQQQGMPAAAQEVPQHYSNHQPQNYQQVYHGKCPQWVCSPDQQQANSCIDRQHMQHSTEIVQYSPAGQYPAQQQNLRDLNNFNSVTVAQYHQQQQHPAQRQIPWDFNNCNSLPIAQYPKAHPQQQQHPSQPIQDVTNYSSVPIAHPAIAQYKQASKFPATVQHLKPPRHLAQRFSHDANYYLMQQAQQAQQQHLHQPQPQPQPKQIASQQPGTSSSQLPLVQDHCVSTSSQPVESPNCAVCNDVLYPGQNGKIGICYGTYACNGCQQFFKRSKDTKKKYKCKNSLENCPIVVGNRSCQLCRLNKCISVGMNPPEPKQPPHKEQCPVCKETAGSKLGFHYGQVACEACKSFFTKMTKPDKPCKNCIQKGEMCDWCIRKEFRMQTCLDAGMDVTKSVRGRPPKNKN